MLPIGSIITGGQIDKTYFLALAGNSGNDMASCLSVIPSTATAFSAGYSASMGSGGGAYDGYFSVLGSSGGSGATYLGGSGDDKIFGIKALSSSTFYLCGNETTTLGTYSAAFVAAFVTGSLSWKRCIGSSTEQCEAHGIVVDGSSNVYIVGKRNSDSRPFVAKYNSSGTLQWKSVFSIGSDFFNYIAIDGSSNLYVLTGDASNNCWVYKLTSAGAITWQMAITKPSGLSVGNGGITVDGSGNVYIAIDWRTSGSEDKSVVACLNSSGTLQWSRSSAHSARYLSPKQLWWDSTSSYLYVAGFGGPGGSSHDSWYWQKYNSSGVLQLSRSWDPGSGPASYWDYQCGLEVDASGGLWFANATGAGGSGGGDMMTWRVPIDGSRTGTYGGITYASMTVTEAAAGFTSSTPSNTLSSMTTTEQASSISSGSATTTFSMRYVY